MKTYGECIHVDIHAMANGLLDMIIENGYAGVLSIGMLPHDIMMCFEDNLDNKFPSKDLLIGDVWVDEEEIKRYKKEMIHDVTCEIYKIATDKKIMIV